MCIFVKLSLPDLCYSSITPNLLSPPRDVIRYHEGLPVGDAGDELAQRFQVDQAALRVAEETISSLKNLCSQKDDSAAKSRGLLSQANQEAFRTRERHAEELKAMTDRLNRLELLSAEMRGRREHGLGGGSGAGGNDGSGGGASGHSHGHAKLDEMAKELIGLRAQVSRKEQELRSHKVSTFQLQTELTNQKDSLLQENAKGLNPLGV